jgi:hypothetical protein
MENHRAATVGIMCCGCMVVLFSLCEAAKSEELFSIDIGKQKEAIAKEFSGIDDVLSQAKLQEARSGLDILEHKIDRLRKNLSKAQVEEYRLKIEKDRKSIVPKEDSLIGVTIEILHAKGVDSAVQFIQNDLRQHGVSDPKIVAVEKRVLEEAPSVNQAQERDKIGEAMKMFESGKLPDSTVDPYIVRTAQLILKAQQDSVKRIEGAQKRKELEEQERLERTKMEKEMKEKKILEEHLAKERKEEEKKKAIEEAAQHKRLEAEEKEKQRLARSEEERLKKIAIAQKDSIEKIQKIIARKAELERASRLRIEEARERKMLADEQRKASQSPSVEGASVKQPVVDKEKTEKNTNEQQQAEKIKAEKAKQALVDREKVVKDSIEGQGQQAEKLKAEQAKQVLDEKAKALRDSVERQRQQAEKMKVEPAKQVSVGKEKAVADSVPVKTLVDKDKTDNDSIKKATEGIESKKNIKPSLPTIKTSPKVLDKSAQAYLQSLKDKQKEAQKKVMEIYDLLEQHNGKGALDNFKQNRAFIAQNLEHQVFNVLEQTVMQSVVEEQADTLNVSPGSFAPETSVKKVSPQQDHYNRINNYLRDNNVDAAYAEFKRSEKQLKDAMTKSEFKQLKNMVENAYKIRHPGK